MIKDTKYLILLTLLYFAVSFIGILHHELWLDEAQHWLLARDSNSVSELIQNTRLEGHPLLWSFMLYGITRLTTNPFWMQFVHILISTAAVIVFLKKVPFNWTFKTLFIFGYFMVFEYNLISRNYMLGVLFLFLACSLFEKREQQFFSICLFLGLACNSHLLFAVPAFALFLTLLVEQIQQKEFFKKGFRMGYLVFIIGLSLIFIQIKTTQSDWLLEPIGKLSFPEKAIAGFISFFKGVAVIPNFRTLHFWNLNLIVDSYKPVAAILGLLIYALPLVLFFKNRKTLFFVYTALIGAQVFFFITQRTSTRFQGMTFLLIIIGLWIEQYYDSEDSKLKKILSSFRLTSLQKPIIYAVLLLHLGAGIYACSMDFKYPFANAKETVDYLKSNKLDNLQIVSVSCEGTPISAYLQKKVYFLCNNSYQSFCRWDSVCGQTDDKQIIAMLDEHLLNEKHFVFVSYYGLTNKLVDDWVNISANAKVRYLNRFDVSIGGTLNYYVFEVSKREE